MRKHDSPAPVEGSSKYPLPLAVNLPPALRSPTLEAGLSVQLPLARNQWRIFSKVGKPTMNVSAWAELRTARQSRKASSASLMMFSVSIRVNRRPML